MKKQNTPLPIIQVLTKNRKIPVFNRFDISWVHTDHRDPLDSLLASAQCQTGAWENACKVYPCVQSHPGRKRFALFHYEPEGITRDEVLRSFEDAHIRPATLGEMLAVTAQYLTSRGNTTVIALGSSNIQTPELSYSSQSLLYRLFITRKTHTRWQRSVEVFPSLNWRNSYSHLHLTKGIGGWKSECLFLGVVLNRDFDTRLVDLKISTDEYHDLPKYDTYPNLEYAPLGSRYVAESGYICEVVHGSEMFTSQWGAGTSVPKIGLRYYRPVFTDV